MSLHVDTTIGSTPMRVGDSDSVHVYVDEGDGDTDITISVNGTVWSCDQTGDVTVPDDGNGLYFTMTAIAAGGSAQGYVDFDGQQIYTDVYSLSGVSFSPNPAPLTGSVTPTFTLDDGGNNVFMVSLHGWFDVSSGVAHSLSGQGIPAEILPLRVRNSNFPAWVDDRDDLSQLIAVVGMPSTPSSLAASVISSSRVDLTWSDPSDSNDNSASSYDVQAATDSGFSTVVQTLHPTTQSVSVNGLTAAKDYWFRVRGSNGSGSSTYSSAVKVTTPAAAVRSGFGLGIGIGIGI